MNTHRKAMFLAITLLLSTLMTMVATPVAAQGPLPLCWSSCELNYHQCRRQAGCVEFYFCLDGSMCNSGLCDDGSTCAGTTDCEAEHCEAPYQACMEACQDGWLPELRVVEDIPIPEGVRLELVAYLDLMQKEIQDAIAKIDASLQQNLGIYRAKLEELRRNKELDDKTAMALIEMANAVQNAYDSEELLSHIMAEPSYH